MAAAYRSLVDTVPLLRDCRFISDTPGKKLSGGFYTGLELLNGRQKVVHPYFAFIYLLRGSGSFTDHLNRSYECAPGCLIFRFPDKPYSLARHDRATWLEFAAAAPTSLYNGLCAAGILSEKITFLKPGLSSEIVTKGAEFVDSLGLIGKPESTAHAYKVFLELLGAMLDTFRKDRQCGGFKKTSQQAMLILGNNLDKKMHMPTVATELGLGYETFRKKFTAECGVTPNEYRVLRRLDKATALLLHTDTPLKEIAISLGYPNASDFVRQYRKRRKISPANFRKSQCGNTSSKQGGARPQPNL